MSKGPFFWKWFKIFSAVSGKNGSSRLLIFKIKNIELSRTSFKCSRLESFKVQVKKLLVSRDRFIKSDYSVKIGLESELAIHARLSDSELVQRKDAIIADNPDFTDVELGVSQIELRTSPIDIVSSGGLANLEDEYQKRFARVLDSARKHRSEYCE